MKDIKDIFDPIYAEAKKFFDKLGQPVDEQKVWEKTAYNWMVDNRGQIDKAGNIQDNLFKAIGAADSFNESQTGVLQDIKMDYEQMIKLINSILDAINKIIEKSAQNIHEA